MHRIAIATGLVVLLAACGTGSTGDPAATPSPTTSPDVVGVVPQPLLDALMQQATAETGVGADQITLVAAEAVTWSDGSIGCPEPGMGYTQALVPGYRVVLEVEGEQLHYHAGEDGQFRACPDPEEPLDEGALDP